ncbi:NUDIX domain-containing protein [Candidatus Peregrinibacteria bacterium]|nr:NUDIX domain-containing protein [Candidatus Peregrinibacteria bacterium]
MGINYDEKSCGIVLFREKDGINLFLLLHYPSGHWDLPKGHVEKGETEHQTAARELLEETGIADIQFIDGFREEISYKYRRNKKISNKQVVFFLAKTSLENIKISFEHRGFKWLPYEAAFNKLTFDNAKNLVKKAENFLEK